MVYANDIFILMPEVTLPTLSNSQRRSDISHGNACGDARHGTAKLPRSHRPAAAVQDGIPLEIIKRPMVKRGFVLLPQRWLVERRFARTARFRHLPRDDERLDTVLKGSRTTFVLHA